MLQPEASSLVGLLLVHVNYQNVLCTQKMCGSCSSVTGEVGQTGGSNLSPSSLLLRAPKPFALLSLVAVYSGALKPGWWSAATASQAGMAAPQHQVAMTLHEAARRGLQDIVARLLAAGSVDARDSQGRTPLWVAAGNGHAAVVRQLLSAGAAIDVANKEGVTPLRTAARAGYVAVVRQLLDAGAAVAVADNRGCTPLHMAAWHRHADVVQQLLDAGAPINAVDASRFALTPLHLATQSGHAAIVQQLLEKGADVDAVANDVGTPLMMAAYKGHTEVAKQLLDAGADTSAATVPGITALEAAARQGHVAVVQLFLAARPPIFGVAAVISAADAAASKGHGSVTATLLKALAARSTTAAAVLMNCVANMPAAEVFKLWMANAAEGQLSLAKLEALQQGQQAQTHQTAMQHLTLGVTAAHQRLQATAGDIVTAAVAAATGAASAGASAGHHRQAAGTPAKAATTGVAHAAAGVAVPAAASCAGQ